MSTFDQYIDNPYDPNSVSYNNETPNLANTIKMIIDEAMLSVHTWLPAQVTQVLGNQKVNIQPLLQIRVLNPNISPTTPNTVLQNLPIIQNVMVQTPMGANYYIKTPIAVGDYGIALFCERAIDNWSNIQQNSSPIVDPGDNRTHNLTDAIFIPGLYPFSQQTTDSTTDLVISNGESELRIKKDGKFAIQNSTQELISNLINLVNTLTSASTVAGGPFIPSVVESLNQILNNLQTLGDS